MKSSHSNNFDFLRLTAAIMVWYGHSCGFLKHTDLVSTFFSFESFGSLGVTIFFVISGYFIAMSYENNRNILHYLKNRALRILPALIAVVLISIFIIGPLFTSLSLYEYFTNSVTWKYLKCILIFPLQYDLPGVFTDNPGKGAVNGSLWTLQHEVRLYGVIALLGILGILRPRVMFILLAALFAFRIYGLIEHFSDSDIVFTFKWGKLELMMRLASQFAAGSFLYLAKDKLPQKALYFLVAAGLVAGSAFLPTLVGNMVFDLAFAYSVIYLGFLKLPILPSVSRFGDFSYGFYLYAYPLQQAFYRMLGGNPDFTTYLITTFCAILLCAVASWHLVEKPALAKK